MTTFETAVESVWEALRELSREAFLDADADPEVWRPAIASMRDELRKIEADQLVSA